MPDPVSMSIGAIVGTLIGTAAEAVLKGTVGEAVKDGYAALKARVSKWASNDVDALEKSPQSAPRKAVLAETIDQLPAEERAAIAALAKALSTALVKSGEAAAVGIDIGRLEAVNLELGKIEANSGATGVRIAEAKISGTVSVDQVKAGNR